MYPKKTKIGLLVFEKKTNILGNNEGIIPI